MLSPGAKGWINKYFDLVDSGDIVLKINRPTDVRKLHFMHLTLGHSGIVFGYPMELIFAKSLNDSQWTTEEKLKLLLFESHLFVYMQIHKDTPFDRNSFIEALVGFYRFHNSSAIKKLFNVFKKDAPDEILESVLTKRIDIRLNILDNKWWVNSLSNALAYLDVILFDDFEHKQKEEAIKNYDTYAENALVAITLAAYSDGEVERKEKDLFNIFLASAHLDDDEREKVKTRFKDGADFEDFSFFVRGHWLLKRFLLDISILTILTSNDALEEEIEYLHELCAYLEIEQFELEESLRIVENFILKSKQNVAFLSDDSKYEKVYRSLTKRWTKVITRNKDKLIIEMKESKELVQLIRKSTSEELTTEEKEAVKTQFKDLAKSIPALTIFMLPGGTILMPILLKLIPDLIPTAFKENEIDEAEEDQS
jgi:ribosomal protein L7/L12